MNQHEDVLNVAGQISGRDALPMVDRTLSPPHVTEDEKPLRRVGVRTTDDQAVLVGAMKRVHGTRIDASKSAIASSAMTIRSARAVTSFPLDQARLLAP
jgi:hypothetical protein